MSITLYNVIHSMNMAIFCRVDHSEFQLISEKPAWLNNFLGSDFQKNHFINLGFYFPFVECFIEEAEAVWAKSSSTPHLSGAWLEYTSDQKEVPLEASAMSSNGDSILIIQDLGEEYYKHSAHMQEYRDKSLYLEQLQDLIEDQNTEIRKREEELTISLLTAADHRDQETSSHIRRIGLYAEVMAKALGWDDSAIADIRIAAPMHDVGKIGIPDRVLLKPGKLTEEEYEVMKQHPLIGADMLKHSDIGLLSMASEIARCHHERWDGKGYPNGLIGTEIPESARITSIVDVYDALCHERVYKKAFDQEQTLQIMSEMNGTHFDPDLYQVFLENLSEMQTIQASHQEKKAC